MIEFCSYVPFLLLHLYQEELQQRYYMGSLSQTFLKIMSQSMSSGPTNKVLDESTDSYMRVQSPSENQLSNIFWCARLTLP